MPHRQTRLRPSFSDWYPKITPGKWHDAQWAREVALAQFRKGGARGVEGERVLPDLHFEFQGGVGVRRTGHEPRRTIPPIP
jgi:hypothetical protein